MLARIRKETWIESRPSYAASGGAEYLSAKEPRMLRQWNLVNKSDRADMSFEQTSEDNGRTWGEKKEVIAFREEDGLTVLGEREGGSPFLDLDNNVVVRFSLEVVLEGDRILSGLKRRRIFYTISNDEGRNYGPRKQLIEKGTGFDAFHYMKEVYYGLNSASIGSKPLKISRDEMLIPIYVAPLDKNARLYNPLGGYTFTYAAFLIGKWKEDLFDLEWKSSEMVKIDPELSNRGLDEPTVTQLKDGRIFAICRGSNSYKWTTISKDNGLTWRDVEALRFDDGGELLSPSSCSLLIRHSDGKLFWIANIVASHPHGNSPRYPLCIAEIDENNLNVKRGTMTIIDTRREGEDEALQLSNFGAYEDRETHEIVVTCARLFPHGMDDWTAPCMKYNISLTE